MKIDDEMLVAYADGELDQAQRNMVDDALAQDEALQARLAALTHAGDLTRALYQEKAEEPVPAALIESIFGTDEVADERLAASTERESDDNAPGWRERLMDWLAVPAPAFVAASVTLVVVGGIIGYGLQDDSTIDGQFVTAGPVSPESTLYTQLETAASGSVVDDNGTRIELVATFADSDRVCREYTAQRKEPVLKFHSAIACRGAAATWEVAFAVEDYLDHDANDGFYETASDKLHEAIDSYLAEHIDVAPLDEASEKALLQNGWASIAGGK